MSTKVTVSCTDQKLLVTTQPLIASGGVQEDVIEFSFCSLWDDFEKTAAFWRNERAVYHVPIVDDCCVIPKEVTLTPGVFLFGVFGTKDGITRTTEAVKYTVVQGAYTVEHIPDPTPSIYEKLLASLNEKITSPKQGAVGQVLAVKAVDSNNKPTEWETVDMASGGGEEWEKVDRITLEESVSCVNISGNGAYSKLYIGLYVPAHTEATANYSLGITLEGQDKLYGNHPNYIAMTNAMAYKYKNVAIVEVKRLGNRFVSTTAHNSNANAGCVDIMQPDHYSPIFVAKSLNSPIWNQEENLEVLSGTCSIGTMSSESLPAGTIIEVWGC